MPTTISESQATTVRAEAGKYLAFTLGRESHGLPVLKVREIIRLVEITQVPQMPAHVRGVINLRGKITPVVDLRIRFGLPVAASTETTCIIVVHVKLASGGAIHMGLIVDGVEEVINLGQNDIEETPDFGVRLANEYLLGMAKVKGKVIALLDIDRVLVASTLEQLHQAVLTP